MSCTGVILAGGASRRMGRDKAFVEVDGVSMIRRVAAVLSASGCTPLLIVGGDQERLAQLALRADAELVADLWPGQGPLGGIITALGHTRCPTLVVATDLAWLDESTTLALMARGEEVTTMDVVPDVVVAASPRLEPLCALWFPSAIPVLERCFASGERAVHRALDAARVDTVEVSSRALGNVNTPEDLLR